MKCHAKTEVYSRVCGYYRPVSQWNEGKAVEYRERVKFNLTLAERSAARRLPVEKAADCDESA